MKNILFIGLLFIGFTSFAQMPVLTQNGVLVDTSVITQKVKDSLVAHRAQLALKLQNITGLITGAVTGAGTSGSPYNISSGGGTLSKTTNKDSITNGTTTIKDNDDPLNLVWYNRNNLKWVEYWQQQMKLSNGNFNMCIMGDSKQEFQVIPNAFSVTLGRKVKMMGQGYTPLTPSSPILYGAALLNNVSTWTASTIGSGGKNLALYSIISKAGSQPLGWTTNINNLAEINFFTDLKVGYYGQATGGTFEIRIDGVLKLTVNTSLLTGVQEAVITGLTDIAHSVSITPLSINCELLHYNMFRTATNSQNGYIVNAFGHAGCVTADYLNADTSLFNPQFRALNINLLAIYLGTNERALATPLATFKTNMHNLVVKVRTLNNKMDIVLFGQVDEDPNGIYFHNTVATTKQYNDQLRQLSIEDSVAFFDQDKLAGYYSSNVQQPWLSDGLHENNYGALTEATNFFGGIPSLVGENNATENIRSSTGVEIYSKGAGGFGISAPTGSATFQTINTTGLNATGTANIGNFQLATGVFSSVSTPHLILKFLTTAQNLTNHWAFENMYGVGQGTAWNQDANIISLNQGWLSPQNTYQKGVMFNVTGFYNLTTNTANTIMTGINYAPTVTALTSAKHRALRTTSGDVLLGTSSGVVGIGSDTLLNSSAILNVNQNDGVNYKGVLIPRLTTQQRDSIVRGIAAITMTNNGTGYGGGLPTVSFSTPGGDVSAIAVWSGVTVGSVSLYKPGQFVTTPTVIFTGGTGTGVAATATLTPIPEGLQIYNLTTHQLETYNGTAWVGSSSYITSLTTTGTSGAAGVTSGVLNIPTPPAQVGTTYTPTLTGTTNVSSVTLTEAIYTVTGSITTVTVSGSITPTATGQTVFTCSLPNVHNGLAAGYNGSVMVAENSGSNNIIGRVQKNSTSLVNVQFIATQTTLGSFVEQFSYKN